MNIKQRGLAGRDRGLFTRVKQPLGYLASKAVPGIVMLLSVPLLLNVVGYEQYGFYAAVLAACLAVISLCSKWVAQAELRYTGVDELSISGLGPVVWYGPAFVAFVLGMALGAVAGGVLNRPLGSLAVSAALCCSFGALHSIQLARLQRGFRSGRYAVSEGARAVFTIVFALVFCFTVQADASSLLLGTACGYLAGLASGFVRARTQARPSISGADMLKTFWLYGWPMSIWAMLAIVLNYSDRWFLATQDMPQVAGSYAATADLVSRGFVLVAFPLTLYFHPKMMRQWNADPRAATKSISRIIGVFSMYCMAAAVVGAGAVLLLDSYLVGPLVQDAWTVLMLCVAYGLWQVGLMAHKILEAMSRTKTLLIVMICSSAATIAVQAMTVSWAGTVGVAFGMAAGAALYVVSSVGLSRKLSRQMDLTKGDS